MYAHICARACHAFTHVLQCTMHAHACVRGCHACTNMFCNAPHMHIRVSRDTTHAHVSQRTAHAEPELSTSCTYTYITHSSLARGDAGKHAHTCANAHTGAKAHSNAQLQSAVDGARVRTHLHMDHGASAVSFPRVSHHSQGHRPALLTHPSLTPCLSFPS